MKIFHALGHLTITCSSPPDVILSFLLGESASIARRQRDAPASEAAGNSDGKVRVILSRIAKQISIDTVTQYAGPAEFGRKEKFRSKRVLPLGSAHFNLSPPVTGNATVEDAWTSLGIYRKGGRHSEELEGVRRLWVLRDEWCRYV